MKRTIGKVMEKANLDEFVFVANKYFQASYVEIMMEHIAEGVKIVGEIIQKEVINPYFEKATTINYINEDDENIKSKSLYIIKVRPLALIHDRQIREVEFPPLPGSNVYEADESDIRLALSLENSGLDIGFLKGHNNLNFNISHDKFIRTHVSILGQTRSGKSYLAAKLAIELLKLRRHADIPSQVAVPVIFDSSGEYSGLHEAGSQNKLAMIMRVINSKEHSFPLLNERYLPLLYDIYEIDEKQESELKVWISTLYESDQLTQIKENPQPDLFKPAVRELIDKYNKLRINSTKQLANSLETFLKEYNQLQRDEKILIPFKVISKMKKMNLKIRKTIDIDIIEQLPKGLIINLSEYENYDERQIAMLLFLRQFYEVVKNRKFNSNIVLFIDEAHNYVPSVYKSFCKEEILRIAREGRKYGITLCLISQRPRWVDPTALSQCGNIFIFRIQNSDDKKHIYDSASLPDSIKNLNIAKFETGEMIVTGDVIHHSLNCIVSKIDEGFIASESEKIADKHMREIRKQSE